MKTVFLNRRFAAKYVREKYGIRCSENSLAKLAIKGGGPPYAKDDHSIWYTNNGLDAWVSALLNGEELPFVDPNPEAHRVKMYDINPSNSQLPGDGHSGDGIGVATGEILLD